ncbi:MAG: nitroreductase family protein [Desulfovibrio sp.]|nr:nitroreductase family protein [Desulfovibrio sp.]
MNIINAISTRRSVRQFTSQPISDEDLHTILTAGMSGPSAVNARPWSFLIVRDRDTLCKMADGNGNAAQPLKGAALGILVLGDITRTFERAPDYWVIDGSIAAQNMILAAHGLGIGSVWLGTWPQEEKIAAQRQLFDLPESAVPHSIIAFGYPEEFQKNLPARGGYEEDRVHYDKW